MAAPTLRTERLTLRPHHAGDWEPMRAFLTGDGAAFVGGPYGLAAAWTLFCSDVAGWDLVGAGGLAVEETATGALVGQVGLNRPPHFPEPEIGWIVFAPHRRRGYAREAAVAARDHAFGALGWPTAVSYMAPANAASAAVARSLGCTLDPDAPRPAGDEGDLVFRHPAPEGRA